MRKVLQEDECMLGCLSVWGKDSQIKQCIEECGELIAALARVDKNNRIGVEENIIEEIADVIITVRQMELLFGIDKVDDILKEKMNKLKKRLEKDKTDY